MTYANKDAATACLPGAGICLNSFCVNDVPIASARSQTLSDGGLDACRIQPLQRKQLGGVAMLDEFVGQTQL